MRVRRLERGNPRGLWTLLRRAVDRHIAFWIQSLAGPLVSTSLLLAVLVLARGQIGGEIWPGISASSFVAPGLAVFALCHSAFEGVAMALLYDKMEGMIQDVLSAPLSTLELLVGWVVGGAACGLMTGALVLAAFAPFVSWPAFDPLQMLLFAVLGALFFALLGIFVGLWARKWDHYTAAESFLLVPLGLLSGTFFLRQDLPPIGDWLLGVNPVFYVIDGFRAGLLGRSDGNSLAGALLLIALVCILTVAAWHLLRRGWRLKP